MPHPKNKKTKMTPKQERFCKEYLIDLNATQAAIRSGYSKKTAYAIGNENLSKPEIKAFIDKYTKSVAEQLGIDAQYVLQGFKEIMERSMCRVPVMEFDRESKSMVQKTEFVKDKNGNMKEVGVWEYDSSGANRALENLAKHLNLYRDNNESAKNETHLHIYKEDARNLTPEELSIRIREKHFT